MPSKEKLPRCRLAGLRAESNIPRVLIHHKDNKLVLRTDLNRLFGDVLSVSRCCGHYTTQALIRRLWKCCASPSQARSWLRRTAVFHLYQMSTRLSRSFSTIHS